MAIVINNQDTSGGVVNISSGYVTTDAVATVGVTTFVCGFMPRVVRFNNLTDRIIDEWYEGMAPASSMHTVATGAITLDLVNGITVTPNGFSVTAVAFPASKAYAWEAKC